MWVQRMQPAHAGCLRARVDPPEGYSTDPCLTAPEPSIAATENQFYRVEVHQRRQGGTRPRSNGRVNNGAMATRVTLSGTELIADNPRGFSAAVSGWS